MVIYDERIICECVKINLWFYFTLYVFGCHIQVRFGKTLVCGNLKDSNIGIAAENIYRTLSLRLCVILLEYSN